MTSNEHTIIIQPKVFGAGFEVIINPATFSVGHDREFQNLAEARAYAHALSLACGWRIADFCEGDT